jgi:outer membrane protein TolC
MKFRLSGCLRRCFNLAVLIAALPLLEGALQAQTLPLQRAIELALGHSTGSLSAHDDVQRAFASYLEIRNSYIPQLATGSGLGYSYGFPLTLEGAAPSLVSVAGQSTIFNPSQLQFMHAAKTEWGAAKFQDKDQRNAIIQDVAISYAELNKWETRLARLQTAESQASEMEKAVSERLQEGVDSAVDLNKAKLDTARIRLHIAEARGSADLIRRHLAHLTGLPLSSIQIEPESIPSLPAPTTDEDLPAKALATSPLIKSADQHAIAEAFRASAEHRALLPSIDFAAQYARLAKYNNYDKFYVKYQPNNATFGVSIRFPFFNAPQRARAQAADAEARKAKEQAQAARNQVSEDTAKLQNAVEQLAASREVAQLEYELAQSNLEATETRTNAGNATLHDLTNARLQASDRFLVFQDVDFEYQRARLNLMRATGDLESWALHTAQK